MKKVFDLSLVCIWLLWLMLFCIPVNAQITHRNLLEKYLIPASGGNLIAQENWKPFPKTADEWRKRLPDSVLKVIIKNGEEALKKQFQPIPSTAMLEYVRTGNRINFE